MCGSMARSIPWRGTFVNFDGTPAGPLSMIITCELAPTWCVEARRTMGPWRTTFTSSATAATGGEGWSTRMPYMQDMVAGRYRCHGESRFWSPPTAPAAVSLRQPVTQPDAVEMRKYA